MLPPDLFERLLAFRPPPVTDVPTRRAAVAAVLALRSDERTHETTPHVLLMKRVEHPRDPWSGHVSFPGGTMEPDDRDLLATALRETREEVGLDLSADARLLCPLTPVIAMGRGVVLDMDVSPFVFRLERESEIRPNDEAEHAFWFPLARAASGELDGVHVWRRGADRRELPCWTFAGQTVWGLTYRMLRDLLGAAGA
ncbi:MAG: CoA pyrophosphatase [Planctomycetes bacterium]|nr:CoA pyrophosphatase [Planctomycetota bacterium]